MKKTLAVLLSLTMLFALCVPAFAAVTPGKIDQTIDPATHATDEAPQDGEGIVKVLGAKEKETYSVTFPASTEIAWDDTAAKDISYHVDCQLLAGATLAVQVSNKNAQAAASDFTIPMDNTIVQDKLNLTATHLNEATSFTGACTAAAPQNAVMVNVPSFAGVAVGDYSTTFTYTVTYTAAPTV